MTKEEKAREIVGQNGGCNGVDCDIDKDNECPAYRDNHCEHRIAAMTCKEFLKTTGQLPREKTLLDEFAIAAIIGAMASPTAIIINGKKASREKDYAEVAYNLASAMMAERARRGEMGNVKEPS